MAARPVAVVVISAFLFLAAVIAVIGGIGLLVPNTPLDRLWELNRQSYAAFHNAGKGAVTLLFALACATCSAGAGLLKGRKWAWWTAVVLFAVNGCGDVISFFVTGDFLRSASGVVVASIFLFYLMRPDVRRFFRSGAVARAASC